MSFRSFSRFPISSRYHIIPSITKPTRTPAFTNASSTSRRTLNTTASKKAPPTPIEKSAASQAISNLAKGKGKMVKGSPAAQLQSEVTKKLKQQGVTTKTTRAQSSGANANIAPGEQSQMDREANLNEAADIVGTKLATEPENVTKEDGDMMHSRETKAFGSTEKGGLASQAQSQAAQNAGDTAGGVNPNITAGEQSQMDREANLDEAADIVGTKLATEPENVTKEDGDLMHSRETKAFGNTEKGGLASQAQSQAAKNAGDTA